MKKSEIKFTVTLNDELVPSKLEWEASDSGVEGKKSCNAMLLSMWDPSEKTTLRIDLWTKDMLVDDMKRFFYENMMTLADTFDRATQEHELAADMKKFAENFAGKAGLFGKNKS
ncbi:MAG: gliding motility protein GldC [Bacteroidetes bacterium]|nr:MAG: gliding motility protein GldC [Bacteroidota bacterium]REK03480.1 MAG: gliding motility protein GldC [Bacteroidota bacterium]REK34785.1 MAG: gliding motility protein GldC [Bacteroidota bacterium]REK51336.1 MAG: gliding motility protein GldC [Bacteroidota bacterium]